MKAVIILLITCFLSIGTYAQYRVKQQKPRKEQQTQQPQQQPQGAPTSPQLFFAPITGYQLGGSFKFYEGKFKIHNNWSYGASLGASILPYLDVELIYNRMDTDADFESYFPNLYEPSTHKISVDYMQLGFTKRFLQGPLRPFLTYSLGATIFNIKTSSIDDEWFFSMTLAGGFYYFINDKIGIKIQSRLLLPLQFEGSGLFLGIGSGGVDGGFGISANAPIVQGDFAGGLVFNLGQ